MPPGTDLFGWNAIPFAREDFDSNFSNALILARTYIFGWFITFVSMFGEDCILGDWGQVCGGRSRGDSSPVQKSMHTEYSYYCIAQVKGMGYELEDSSS